MSPSPLFQVKISKILPRQPSTSPLALMSLAPGIHRVMGHWALRHSEVTHSTTRKADGVQMLPLLCISCLLESLGVIPPSSYKVVSVFPPTLG